MKKMMRVAGIVTAIFLIAGVIHAADTPTSAWNGSTVLWTTTGNWSGGVPDASISALFDSTFLSAFQPQLQGTSTVQGIYLKDGVTQDVTITGLTSARILNINGDAELGGQTNAGIILDDVTGTNNNLTIGNLVTTTLTNNTGFYVNSAGTLSLSGSGTLNLNGKTLTLAGTNSSGNIIISQVISSAGAINVNTSGTATLSGNNTFTGGLTLTAGTLKASGNATALGNGTLTLNGGTLDFNHSAALAFNRNTTVGGDVEIISQKNTAGAGVTYTLGTLAIGANTLTVSGGNVNSGTAGLTFGTTTLSGAATFDIKNPTGGGTTQLSLGAVANGANTATLKGNGNFVQTGVWGNGSGGLTLDSTYTGIATLSQNNTFTGAVTVNAGTLRANGNAGALGAGAATLVLNGGTLDFNHSAALAFNRNTTVGGDVKIISQKNSAGGGVTYTLGTLSIGANTLTVEGGNVNSGTAGLTFGATTLTGAATFDIKSSTGSVTQLSLGAIANGAHTVTLKGNGNFIQTGVLGNGSGGLTLDSTYTGLATLSQANTYTGATTVNGGVLRLSNATALPGGIGATGGASNLTMNGGYVELANGNFQRALGTGADQVQITGGNSGFSANGAARIVNLGGAGASVTWGSASFNPTILVLNGSTANNTLDFQNPLDLGAGARTISIGANTVTLSGAISGTGGSLIKTGSGSLTLSKANSYDGGTTFSAGTLTLSNAAALGTGPLTLNGGSLVLTTITLAGNTIVLNNSVSMTSGLQYGNTGSGQLRLGNSGYTISAGGNNDSGVGFTVGNTITDASGNNTLNAFDVNWSVSGSTTMATLSGNITLRDNQTLNATLGNANGLALTGIISDGSPSNGYGLTIGGSYNSGTAPTGSVGGGGRGSAVMLGGANTYTGTTTINTGTVLVLGIKGGSTSGSLNPSSSIVNNGVFAFNRTNTLTQGIDFGTISGSGAVTQSASGTTVLNAANSYSGRTTVVGGTLSVNSIENAGVNSPLGAYATAGAAGISLSGGTLKYTGSTASTDRGFTLGGSATIDVRPASGTSTLTMGASSIGAYTLTVTGGTGSGLALSGLTFTAASGGLAVDSPATLTLPSTITMPTNFALTLSGTGTSNYPVNLNTGTSTLTKSGTGAWTLDEATTAANLSVSGGTLAMASGKSLSVGSGSSNSFTITIGKLDASAAASFTANVGTFAVNGSSSSPYRGDLLLSASNTITASTEFRLTSNGSIGNIATAVTPASSSTTINTPSMVVGDSKGGPNGYGLFTLGSSATLTLGGISGGRTALIIGRHNVGSQGNGAIGTLDLSAGSADLKLSSIIIGQKTGTGGTASPITGTLTFNSGAVNHLDISGTGNVVLIGASAAGYTATGTATFAGLDATSAITTTAGSTAILIGSNASGGTAHGTLNINGGTLKITTTGAAIAGGGGTTRALNLSGGAKLIAGASSTDWISGLTTATIGTGGATIDTAGNDIGFSQSFSGTGGLIKDGTGTLELKGNSTYAGATQITAGKLTLTGSLGTGTVTVGAAGTLGGIGTINGDLVFVGGAKLDLTGAILGETSGDILTVAAGKAITLTNFGLASIIGWDWAAADLGTYTLINGGSGVTLAGTTPTASSPYDFGNGKSGYFQAGSLQLVVIPEPATFGVVLGVLAAAILRRRRML